MTGNATVKWKRLPPPGRLSTSISPPIRRANSWLIASPRPTPDSRRRPWSACSKGAKMRSWSSGAMPMPVSSTEKRSSTRPSSARAQCTPRTTRPVSVNLMALPSRLSRICRRRLSSASTTSGRSIGQVEEELQPLVARIHAHHRDELLEQRAQPHRRGVELQVPGPDPGQIEQVVDQGQQVAAAARDRIQRILARRLPHAAHAQQIGIAEDRVQRRAQLVAHAGEELVLGAVGGLGGGARRQQRLALAAQHADPEEGHQQDRREHRHCRPDRRVVDLALVAHRQPLLRDLALLLLADGEQHLVQDARPAPASPCARRWRSPSAAAPARSAWRS